MSRVKVASPICVSFEGPVSTLYAELVERTLRNSDVLYRPVERRGCAQILAGPLCLHPAAGSMQIDVPRVKPEPRRPELLCARKEPSWPRNWSGSSLAQRGRYTARNSCAMPRVATLLETFR